MIKKTYTTYHWLLIDFLDEMKIKDRFINTLMAYNGFGISTYINETLLKEGTNISFAITAAFPFTHTLEKKFWDGINKAWQQYLIAYMVNDIPKSKLFKSIW